MKCREFRDISESYISDELLVETNHQVNHHLEHCPECRADFVARRDLRSRVNRVGRNAAEFQIDPIFSSKLESRLKDEALRFGFWGNNPIRFNMLLPSLAAVIIMVGFGLVYLGSAGGLGLIPSTTITRSLGEIVYAAAGAHEECALEKLERWEAMEKTDYPEKAVYTENFLKPLQAKYSGDLEMLSVHDCIFDGKRFTHVVLRNRENILSVLLDKSDAVLPNNESPAGPIMSEGNLGYQIAGFSISTQPIFVVSDLPEAENLTVARALSYSMNKKS